MDHLTAEQLQDIRTDLERQLAKLERSMKVTDEAARPVELDQTAVGRLSRMDSLQNQALTQNLKEREQHKLALLREALARIDREEFGICTACDGAIPIQRLFVFPEAPVCAACSDSL